MNVNPFNIFETCFLDVDKSIFLEKDNITRENKNIITLLKYYDEISNRTFHLGDIYYNKKNNSYYIFSFLKDTRLINSNGVIGFGFYIFEQTNSVDFTFYKIKEFNDKFDLSLFDNNFKYIDNIFSNKNKFNRDASNHFFNIRNLNNFWIILKDMTFSEYELTALIPFYVVEKIIHINNFYFYIKMYQKNKFNQELSDPKSIVNGSLFMMNDYAKEIHKERIDFFMGEISRNNDIKISIEPSVYDNIAKYYDKLFVYIDKTGSIQFISIYEYDENIRKSKNLIFIKQYLFENILAPPFCKDKEKECYLDAILSLVN